MGSRFSVQPFSTAGNIYVTGAGAGMPVAVTPGAAQTNPGGGTCFLGQFPDACPDAYVGKADPAGNLVFGTLLGGPTGDSGTALAVDSAGDVFVAGTTGGSFPTTANAAIATSTTSKVFAAKINANGTRFVYSTYLSYSPFPASMHLNPIETRLASASTLSTHEVTIIVSEPLAHFVAISKSEAFTSSTSPPSRNNFRRETSSGIRSCSALTHVVRRIPLCPAIRTSCKSRDTGFEENA